MPQFLLTIHRPNNYNPATAEDATMRQAIDHLNNEMVAAGIRVFVGGLQSLTTAKSVLPHPAGHTTAQPTITHGPYLKTPELIGGLWVLDLPTIDQALIWATKAALACRAPVEVRPFH
jgi:hypothetical protein